MGVVHSAADLARIAASLNNRPRKTLGFMKPSEKLAELLAHTAWIRRVKSVLSLYTTLREAEINLAIARAIP